MRDKRPRDREDGRYNPESKFVEDGSGLVPSQCLLCKHLERSGQIPVCPAFPGHIPPDIFLNKFDHHKPFDGDDVVLFEARENVPEKTLKRLATVFPK